MTYRVRIHQTSPYGKRESYHSKPFKTKAKAEKFANILREDIMGIHEQVPKSKKYKDRVTVRRSKK